MTTRYTEKQIEDVAYIFSGRGMPDFTRHQLVGDFADLFAADNPPVCSLPDDHVGDCEYTGGKATIGFDRDRFLKACGLESEG